MIRGHDWSISAAILGLVAGSAVGVSACGDDESPSQQAPTVDAGYDGPEETGEVDGAVDSGDGGDGGDGSVEDAGVFDCEGYALLSEATARYFALQPRLDVSHLVSYETYRNHLRSLVETRVAPCREPGRVTVIVFPEDTGLPAAFLGSRGKSAREKSSSTAAFVALLGTYASPIAYYKDIFADQGIGEMLGLSTTDTVWRAFYETMREIAIDMNAYVISSANVSGRIEKSTAPADIEALGDPDIDASYVYIAKDRHLYNAAFVFSPAGDIVAAARKPYLVPAEEDPLQLSYGPLADLAPIDIKGMRIGVLTSKDAWMSDTVDRLAIQGAQVIVQPEAFSGWGIEELPGDWLPDVFLQSGWSAVQKHGAFRYGVIPHLTGNLFELVFDGQTAILGDAVPGDDSWAYVGQDPKPGFLVTAPWVDVDPGQQDTSLSLEQRRQTLHEAGEALLPGGFRENAYVETVVAADLNLDGTAVVPDGTAGALGPSLVVAEDTTDQSYPSIASDGNAAVVVAWQAASDTATTVMIAASTDGGASFSAPVGVPSEGVTQRTPSLLFREGQVYAAYQVQDGAGARSIDVAVSDDGGLSFTKVADVPVTQPSDAWLPVLAATGDGLVMAFVDAREGNERVRVARLNETGKWEVVDADSLEPSHPAPNTRNNQWSPSIAAQGDNVAVAWVAFRDFHWDVFVSLSSDGGQTFGLPVRVDDAGTAPERIHNDPSLLFLQGGELLCSWTDVRDRKPSPRVRWALGAPDFGVSKEVSTGSGDAPGWLPSAALLPSGKVAIAWQDFRTAGNDIYMAVSDDGGTTFGSEQRLDDGGDGASYQRRPKVAVVGSQHVGVVWEDSRSGRRQIRYVTGELL